MNMDQMAGRPSRIGWIRSALTRERWCFRWMVWGSVMAWITFAPALAAGSRFAGDYILTYWETDDGLPGNSATAMVQMPDGYLWFGTFNGLVRFDGEQFTVLEPTNTPELASAGIVNLHRDRKGALWCSTLKGMARLENGRWTQFGPAQGWTSDYARTFAETP